MAVAGIVAHGEGTTNAALVDEWSRLGIDARLLSPEAAIDALGAGDVALLRIDVS